MINHTLDKVNKNLRGKEMINKAERLEALIELPNMKLANIRVNFIETGFKPLDTTMRDALCILESWTNGKETYMIYIYFKTNGAVEHVVKIKM